MQQGSPLRKSPPLLPIFRSRSLALLLAYLSNSDARERLNLSQLAKRLDLATSTLTRDVAELERAGLVITEAVANSKLVRLNEESPYYPELSSLLHKAFGPPQTLVELLGDIAGIEEAFIFGSWAARYLGQPGDQPADIDLLVVSDGQVEIDRINGACRRASRILGREVNPVVVSANDWAHGDSGFLRTLRSQPRVPLDLS
jgi:DNA-binding transcriptional ArsR family regulator